MNTYSIARVENRTDFEKKLPKLEKAQISCFPWPDVNKLKPVSQAALACDQTALHVWLHSNEQEIRAEVTEQNGPVHTDSCLEFFFMPSPNKSRLYLNFETNPLGVFFLSTGTERSDRRLITEENARYFDLITHKKTTEENGSGWEVCYTLPFAFIKKYVPEFEASDVQNMHGNFYKCGDALPAPHWACWNPISTPKPDFHRPEFFGALNLK